MVVFCANDDTTRMFDAVTGEQLWSALMRSTSR